MCRGGLSAHGRASPALSVEAFPHDFADPPTAGLGRMCSTAPTGPAPHARYRQRPPRHRGRAHNTARATPRRWPRPIADPYRSPGACPVRSDDDWPEDTADPWPAPEFFDKTLCIYNCVVLPDTTATSCTSTSSRLNAPTGAWCPPTSRSARNAIRDLESQCTYRCVVLPDTTSVAQGNTHTESLNAPTGAWCPPTVEAVRRVGEPRLNAPTGARYSLTRLAKATVSLDCLNAPTGAWCSLTGLGYRLGCASDSLNAPTGAWCSLTRRGARLAQRSLEVSMHLQVRGAP